MVDLVACDGTSQVSRRRLRLDDRLAPAFGLRRVGVKLVSVWAPALWATPGAQSAKASVSAAGTFNKETINTCASRSKITGTEASANGKSNRLCAPSSSWVIAAPRITRTMIFRRPLARFWRSPLSSHHICGPFRPAESVLCAPLAFPFFPLRLRSLSSSSSVQIREAFSRTVQAVPCSSTIIHQCPIAAHEFPSRWGSETPSPPSLHYGPPRLRRQAYCRFESSFTDVRYASPSPFTRFLHDSARNASPRRAVSCCT